MELLQVRLDEPRWWYGSPSSLPARLLAPASALWGLIAERQFRTARPYHSKLPVVCIGNFTAGGTGKTPLAMKLAEIMADSGHQPAFLTRGYGGLIAGPHWVDANLDRAGDVGDEPLLLARVGPVMVSRRRAAGAKAVEAMEREFSVIIMDDGLQNPSLAKTFSLAVIDAQRGIGNGRVMPAGPLRASFDAQLARVDAIVVNHGGDFAAGGNGTRAQGLDWLNARFRGPILAAATVAAEDVGWLRETPVIAFAAIGAPERFFRMLVAQGADVLECRSYPDHHTFSEADAGGLLARARARSALLVTTDKDLIRLGSLAGLRRELWAASRAMSIRIEFAADDESRLLSLIEKKVPLPRPSM